MPRDLRVFTRKDVDLMEALASLARHQPDEKCAAHLVQPAEDLARRLRDTLPIETEDNG